MQAEYLDLSYWQLALATLLILVNGGVSLALGLGLERRLLLASVRTLGQLLLVGLVLRWIFALAAWYAVVAMLLVMTLIAGLAAVRRTERRWPCIWLDSLLSMWASSWLIGAVALLAIVQVEPWYRPQYAIPLMGMILGNTLNGIALGLDRLGEELATKRDQIETLLALGATRWEALTGAVLPYARSGIIGARSLSDRRWAACNMSTRSRPRWPDRVFAEHRPGAGLGPHGWHSVWSCHSSPCRR